MAAEGGVAVEPGSLRHQVMLTAQKFKSSWVELGSLLVRVRRDGGWRDWGFSSFEEYCTKELRLKRQTAEKLTASYSFLTRHERDFADATIQLHSESPRSALPPREAPAFEVVSVLARAEESGQLGEEDYQALRESIWSDARPPAQVARELSKRFPPPAPEPPASGEGIARLVQSAKRLAQALSSCEAIPSAIAERAEALHQDLLELTHAGARSHRPTLSNRRSTGRRQ